MCNWLLPNDMEYYLINTLMELYQSPQCKIVRGRILINAFSEFLTDAEFCIWFEVSNGLPEFDATKPYQSLNGKAAGGSS